MSQTTKSHILISTSTPNESISSTASKYGVKLFINSGKPGIAHDWNCAIEHCETPLVTIAHQDDLYEPRYTERMLDKVNSSARPLIFFSGYGELRPEGKVTSNKLLNIKRTLLKPLEGGRLNSSRLVRRRCLSLGSPICCPAVTCVMPNLNKPMFVEGFKSDLDWQAWEKFSRMEGSFAYDPEVLMWHRIHGGSETSALIKDNTRTKEDLAMRLPLLAQAHRHVHQSFLRSRAEKQRVDKACRTPGRPQTKLRSGKESQYTEEECKGIIISPNKGRHSRFK